MKHGIPDWLRTYQRSEFSDDALAGVIVAIMLVPQSMAYALLAGLPPEVGLYASILPLILYGLIGSSRVLAVGPVAIVSLMTASAIGTIAAQSALDYITIALILAFLSGVILLVMGVLRLGFLVNFLSHPVISGFTTAAALIIGFSQLKHLLGVSIPRSHRIDEILVSALNKIDSVTVATIALSIVTLGILYFSKNRLGNLLVKKGVSPVLSQSLSRAGPLFAVILTTLVVWWFQLDGSSGVNIIGDIPSGLPPITFAPFSRIETWYAEASLFLPPAFLIAIVGFLESVSVAKALASKRRQKIDANRELLGLGAANVGAAFTGGYPVTGGFSRSVVNFSAGAKTPMASFITAALILVTVLFLTPLFYYLPKAVLAAIIIVAVMNLLDFKFIKTTWQYSRTDAIAAVITFVSVLFLGIEKGIIVGIVFSIGAFLWRTSRPHVAIVGRVGNSEHFRNIERHDVSVCDHVVAIRVDESLYFANTRVLEDTIFQTIANQNKVKHVVLICSAINSIDASALETLENILDGLHESGVTLHLAEVKGPVEDRLKKTDFFAHLEPGGIYLSTDQAMTELNCV